MGLVSVDSGNAEGTRQARYVNIGAALPLLIQEGPGTSGTHGGGRQVAEAPPVALSAAKGLGIFYLFLTGPKHLSIASA